MKTQNVKVKASKSRKWLKRTLVTLAIIIFLPITLFTIGWLNRDRILNMLQERYSENGTGTLTIGKVNASFLSGFPNVGFTLKDIHHTNSDTITDQFSTLQIEETKLVIGAGKLLRGDFAFKRIAIKNAVFSSEVISKRTLAYHEQLKLDRPKRKGFQFPEWLNREGASLTLDNVKYIMKDQVLNKNLNLHIHSIRSNFKGNDQQINGTTKLDITVNNLGFNTQNGSFFNGAHVTGNSKFNFDIDNNQIDIPVFPLQIDHQTFQLHATFDLSEISAYVFNLENSQTDFKAVKGLLTNNLSDKLKNYDIQKPFKTSAKIAGNFAYGNDPDITATFSTTNNDVVIANKFHFKNTSFSGNFTTDIYETDSLRILKKSTKDFKLYFDSLNAILDDIKVDFRDSYFQSTPEALNFINANLRLNGSNATLASIIDTDNFDFKGGKFNLNTHIEGDIPNPYQFLNKATGEFNLNDTHVVLKKNGLQLPIQYIAVSLQKENALLRELVIKLLNGEDLIFTGSLKNISGLLSKTPTLPTTSQISIHSKNLNINDLLVMAKEFVPKSNEKIDDRKDLHETLEAIYSQFHPQFSIDIAELKYNNVSINDLKSNIELIDSETILLRNFNFKYDEAITHLKGKVRVHGPQSNLNDAIYLNAEATSSGPIKVFKDLFNITLFRIDSGDYKFNGQIKGNIKQFNELLNSAQGDLNLNHINLYYEPAEMEIAIDSLSLIIDNSEILLKQFNLKIDELHHIMLDGNIKQFPNILLDEIQDPGSVFLKITASFMDGDELLATVNSFKNEEKPKAKKSKKALHTIFKDINRFNPEIELDIDSLKYKVLITENIKAQIYFENDSILKLNYLDLHYKETVANIYGEINAHSSQTELLKNNPFDLDFYVKVKGKSEDLNDYLKTTNFVFKSGDFEFFGNYKAQSKDLKLLNSEGFGDLKIGGTMVHYKAANLQIPMDSLHIEINNDLATLKTLDIKLPGKSKVYFSGAIDHFSEFINNGNDLNNHRSNFSVYAPYIDTFNIKEFLEQSTIGDPDNKSFDLNKWKESMRKINKSFYPNVVIQIDTLKHERLIITGFESALLFDKNGDFKIDDTQLDYYGGSIKMDVSVGIATENKTPVVIDMIVNNMDLHEILISFDYFNNDDLRAADSIQGNLNFQIKGYGSLDNEGKLKVNSLNGILQLELKNFALYNYKPLMENVPLMKAERFKNLQFRPIVQTFEIRNGNISIPQTEIQSSAIHLFAEGNLKLDEYMNIWLSVPWQNLKRNDGLSLPEKKAYKDAGAKFFVQFLQDKNNKNVRKQKLKVKIKLGNRKLRKMQN
ncbi:AsmA-like C-terminal region-containing protein [Gelidibacter sp.]|uniref:AsmA-like C-terminal region-containing protein n=1 Tax=Gelidibacter sp. TaxID=2018083 RepID=UPI003264BA5E